MLDAIGDFVVLCASADEMPNLLYEIGRLREITFRGAGEGTDERTRRAVEALSGLKKELSQSKAAAD